jgi:hypothetical protein
LIKDNTENININENKILNLNDNVKIMNYKQAYDAFNKNININKIKNFLKKIFYSNVIRETFEILYPYYINFPFQTEKDTEDYINKYINMASNILKIAGIEEKNLDLNHFKMININNNLNHFNNNNDNLHYEIDNVRNDKCIFLNKKRN